MPRVVTTGRARFAAGDEAGQRGTRVTTTQLRTFVAVAESGSVRAAAERLTVTQSAVSAALSALQRQVGTALVTREGRGIRLTPAGVCYADYTRRILGLLAEATVAAAGEADAGSGLLRLAAVTTAGEHLVPARLVTFRSAFPDVRLHLEVGTRRWVFSLLREHHVDIAIAGRPPHGEGLVTRAVRGNELVVVGAPRFVREMPDPRDVVWLLREPGSGTRDTTDAVLENLQADPPRLTLGSNGAVIAGAVGGLGLTLVSRDAVRAELDNGSLMVVPVTGTPLDRPYHVVTGTVVPPTARLFIDHLLNAADTDRPPFRPPTRR